MAKSNNNVVMYGTSGKIGDLLIFSQRAGKTIISKISQRSKTLSAKQLAVTEKFKAAATYAKNALKNAAIKLFYKEKAGPGVYPFNVALADYFNAPEVTQIDLTGYTGLPNSTIRILAEDDVKVTNVHVTVTSSTGSIIEEGDALLDADSAWFVYTAMQTNSTLSGTTIEVAATDMASNTTTKEALLP